MSPGKLKKPLLALNRIIGHSSAKNHMSKPKIGDIDQLDDERTKKNIQKIQEKRAKEYQVEEEKKLMIQKRSEEEKKWHEADGPEIARRYGTQEKEALAPAKSLQALVNDYQNIGKTVSFRARIHHVRALSSKLAFVVFRDQIETVQGVLSVRDGVVSEDQRRVTCAYPIDHHIERQLISYQTTANNVRNREQNSTSPTVVKKVIKLGVMQM